MITFGEQIKYALHLQIPFRFVRDNEVILGNFDMFEPTSEMVESPDFDWKAHQDMGWDNPGKNRYDEIAKKIFVEEDYIVSNAEVNKLYDLKIFFTNGGVLETFGNSTGDLEFWRFFEEKNKERNHLVILKSGIEHPDCDG
jgi:uridine kinase